MKILLQLLTCGTHDLHIVFVSPRPKSYQPLAWLISSCSWNKSWAVLKSDLLAWKFPRLDRALSCPSVSWHSLDMVKWASRCFRARMSSPRPWYAIPRFPFVEAWLTVSPSSTAIVRAWSGGGVWEVTDNNFNRHFLLAWLIFKLAGCRNGSQQPKTSTKNSG